MSLEAHHRSILTKNAFTEIPGLLQQFIQRDESEFPCALIAKVVDDLPIVGLPSSLTKPINNIKKPFKMGRVIRDTDTIFYCILISRNHDAVTIIDMTDVMEKITPIELSRECLKQTQSNFTDAEKKRFLQIKALLNFLGHGTLIQAAYAASELQQHIGGLKMEQLILSKKILYGLKRLPPSLIFKTIPSDKPPCFLAFSYEIYGHSTYGQTGYISSTFLKAGGERGFHAIEWCSAKQSRVSFSSFGAEIIAAAYLQIVANFYQDSSRTFSAKRFRLSLPLFTLVHIKNLNSS